METQPVNTAIQTAVMRESAIVALLEDYGRFLIKHKRVSSMEECRDKIGQIISLAMDRGDATQNTLAHIERWLSKRTVNTDFTCCCKRIEKYLSHALVEEMGEVMQEHNIAPDDPSYAEFKQAYDLYLQCKQATEALVAKYGQQVKSIAAQFIMEYKQAFDPEFVAKVEQAKNC